MSSAPRKRRSRALRVIRYAVALGLLAFVAQTVPWTDTLVVGGETWTGEILGEWKGPSIRFRFGDAQELDGGSVLAGTPAGSAVRYGGLVTATHTGLESRAWTPTGAVADPDSAPQAIAAIVDWRPGMPRALSDLDYRGLLPAFAFLILASLFGITRWWRLLAHIGCETRWMDAMRLTYIGLFFNLVVPGLNGGDLVRGVLVVREHPERRADALTSVVVDRLLGLLAMIGLAVFAIFASGGRLRVLELPVALVFTGMLAGLAAFMNPTLRRLTRFDRILARLPQAERLKKLDRALLRYLRHPGELAVALVLSLGNHLSVTACIHSIAHAFGDSLTFLDYLSVVTVANTLSSIPIAPGGWGVGEAAFGKLFQILGASATLGVATSITYRLCTGALGIAGGVFLILPGGHSAREQLADSGLAETDAVGPGGD